MLCLSLSLSRPRRPRLPPSHPLATPISLPPTPPHLPLPFPPPSILLRRPRRPPPPRAVLGTCRESSPGPRSRTRSEKTHSHHSSTGVTACRGVCAVCVWGWDRVGGGGEKRRVARGDVCRTCRLGRYIVTIHWSVYPSVGPTTAVQRKPNECWTPTAYTVDL